jgi:N-acetylmuramoyl-L-alanine amidase
MIKQHASISIKKTGCTIFGVLVIFTGIFLSWSSACAAGPKTQYLAADSCYKMLRHSPAKQKQAGQWLKCINMYKDIQKQYPQSTWSAAGMFKAAQLLIKLAEKSGNSGFRDQADDLLKRLRTRYPESAWSKRAKRVLAPSESGRTIKYIRSKKRQTKKNKPARKIRENQKKEQPAVIETPAATEHAQNTMQNRQPSEQKNENKDGIVNDLRFWSNPDYTRIVVNLDRERDYSYRLLKKDPKIHKPFERLYVDIDRSRLGKSVASHTPINDNLLQQARAGQYLPHTVRVVVDIKSFENYKIFSLKDPFRIIIDVWGKGSSGSRLASSAGSVQKSKNDQKPVKLKRITTDNLKSSDIARQFALGVRKIVIDPGHGGPDPGAPGYFRHVWEKDIVLKLAKKLAKILRAKLKCTVILTRSTDKKLTLEGRTAIANTKRADLFISLHCNAAKNRRVHGIETYILNLATDDQAIAVAARENATSKKNISDLEYILSDLMKNAKIEESTRLANLVHHSIIQEMRQKYSKITDLGVKQAPFYVLLGARMPSILVETSFISNKRECRRLMNDSYQTAICNAIADGVKKYIDATNPKQL